MLPKDDPAVNEITFLATELTDLSEVHARGHSGEVEARLAIIRGALKRLPRIIKSNYDKLS